jgi:hypothetical protein
MKIIMTIHDEPIFKGAVRGCRIAPSWLDGPDAAVAGKIDVRRLASKAAEAA